MPYRWMAEYYDPFFAPYRDGVDRAREQVLGAILPRIDSACDLACGSGSTAMALARRGIRTYAVDLSPTMCANTRRKARAQRLPVTVMEADMRRFELPEQVDLVICEYDAINHIARKAGLPRVMQAVSRALKPGGWFYFDVNTRRAFERYWHGVLWDERPGVVMVLRFGSQPERDRAWADVEWFIQKGKLWDRKQERVDQVCWSAAEIRAALSDAGFARPQVWDGASFYHDNGLDPRCRSVYLARKKAGYNRRRP